MDMEGVLTPEIWIAVAERTGIDGLRLTTRDIANYDELMQHRLRLLKEHQICLSRIQEVIAGLEPLPGAVDFLDQLRARFPVLILSDTFEEFARPLLRKLNYPTLFCHKLAVENDSIVGYCLRVPDQKRRTVELLRQLNFSVVSIGDSYNDVSMLLAADFGILFRAPAQVRSKFPQIPAVDQYEELMLLISKKTGASDLNC